MTGHAAGPGHGSMHFLCISRLHSDLRKLFRLLWSATYEDFFLLALFWNTSTFIQMHLLARIRKRCNFETAVKVNAQVVCITTPPPKAAPFVCSSLPVSLFSSAVWRKTMKIISVFHSPELQLSERINITFTFQPEKIQWPSSCGSKLCWACPLSLHIVTFKMLLQHLTCFLVTFV